MRISALTFTLAGIALLAAPVDRKDVEFGHPGAKPLLLDLHIPDGVGPFPAAILVHGGGFDEGSRSTNVRPLFEPLANAGFAWFSIDYRLAPEAHFPEALADVNSAIRWLKAHSAEYNVDANKIVLIGESAGGYLVNYAGTHDTAVTKVAAVVDFYGPVDYAKLVLQRRDHPENFNMASMNRHAANGGGIHFFGVQELDAAGVAKLQSVSPILGVHAGMPPFLCIHGTKDDQVSYDQSVTMCDAMHKVGAACELIAIEGGGHGMAGWRAPEMQHWKPEMIAWLQKTLATATTQTDPAKRPVVAGIPANYDEENAGAYTLPDPLVLANGKQVRDAKTWTEKRRPEIVHLFEENQYGRSPARPPAMTFDVFDKGTPAFDGAAIRKQVTILFSGDKAGPKMDLLVYVPAHTSKPVPLLLNLSFTANSNTVNDPGVKPGEVWGRDRKKVPADRSRSFGKIDVARLVNAGFGFATAYYGDIEPDFEGGLPYGVRASYLKPGQTEPAPDEWGAIAAWAWGLSRAMDYLETDQQVDSKRVAILGVSRLGKTVMWAGAHDQRFALTIASCSGEGGAALSRRYYGETIAHLSARYPYQFCANYGKYAEHVDSSPVDAHMLVALMAPRPVLLQTGDKDYWSDPKGEFLAAVAAGPVYRVFGKKGLDTDRLPPAGTPILHDIGYYMHAGGHGTLPADWDQYLTFLQMHLQPKQ